MAIQISKTVGEFFAYSGYRSCPSIYAYLDANYPGWTEDTVIDVLEWSEGLRAAGEASNVNYGFYRALNLTQCKEFIPWVLGQLLTHVDGQYSRKTDLEALKTDIEDFIAEPTLEKGDDLAGTAKDIRPEPGVMAETYVANAFKAVAAALAASAVSGAVVAALGFSLVKAARFLSDVDQLDTHNAILTKLQQIIGVVD